MTADIVVSMAESVQPVMWILHEWWTDEMIVENLKLRNIVGYDIEGKVSFTKNKLFYIPIHS